MFEIRRGGIRVFHGLVNYGTQAGFLSQGLRDLGIEALSVCFPDKYMRQIDTVLLHGGNLVQKVLKHSWNWLMRLTWFFKYNTFHFYYGTSLFPRQWDLPLYRIFGKKVIMHYLGNDVQGYMKSIEKYRWTNMPSFIGDNDPVEYDSRISERLKYETKYVNLQCVCAPCYSEFVPGSIVIPLAIDLRHYNFEKYPDNQTFIIVHAPSSRGFKGTDYIVSAIQKLVDEGYSLEFRLIENMSNSKLKEEYKKADLFIDQIMAGWYGMAAIEAMAIGRPVVSYIRESYFRYIDYGDRIPVITANPDTIYDTIKNHLINRSRLPEIGLASRHFVEEVHDLKKVAPKVLQLYSTF